MRGDRSRSYCCPHLCFGLHESRGGGYGPFCQAAAKLQGSECHIAAEIQGASYFLLYVLQFGWWKLLLYAGQ